VRYPEIVNCHAFLVLAELLGGQVAAGVMACQEKSSPCFLFRVFGRPCLGSWLHDAGNVIETHEHIGEFKEP
jgi:hypothetical protein